MPGSGGGTTGGGTSGGGTSGGDTSGGGQARFESWDRLGLFSAQNLSIVI